MDIKKNRILDLEELTIAGVVIEGKMQAKFWVPSKPKLSKVLDNIEMNSTVVKENFQGFDTKNSFDDNKSASKDVYLNINSSSSLVSKEEIVMCAIKIQASYRGYKQRQNTFKNFQDKMNLTMEEYSSKV